LSVDDEGGLGKGALTCFPWILTRSAINVELSAQQLVSRYMLQFILSHDGGHEMFFQKIIHSNEEEN
jgi:hypothetical protein